MVRMGKIVISVIAIAGYNDEILSSPDRRYKRFLLLLIFYQIKNKYYFEIHFLLYFCIELQ